MYLFNYYILIHIIFSIAPLNSGYIFVLNSGYIFVLVATASITSTYVYMKGYISNCQTENITVTHIITSTI